MPAAAPKLVSLKVSPWSERGGASFLLGSFSYADVVMATLLQGVAPVSDRFIRLGPDTRRAWTQEGLASEYADLLAWRDAIYDKQRRAR